MISCLRKRQLLKLELSENLTIVRFSDNSSFSSWAIVRFSGNSSLSSCRAFHDVKGQVLKIPVEMIF